MEQTDDEAADNINFGRYQVLVRERGLRCDGLPVAIGDRAFDLLLALLESPGSAISKDQLLKKVWLGRPVQENALQAQITALRRALGEDRDLIVTVPGRGYQLAAEPDVALPADASAQSRTALPERLFKLVGRERDVRELITLAKAVPFVTLVGPGGVGKTQLAFEVARRLAAARGFGVHLVELPSFAQAEAAQASVTAALAGGSQAASPLLLVLDGCEQWIDVSAQLAESALRQKRLLRIIATSREPLRAEGEATYRLAPLELPPDDSDDHDAIGAASAVEMFLGRLLATRGDRPDNADIVAPAGVICQRLDGLPLAIEMAAVRAARFGIDWMLAHLDDPLPWLKQASRTAPARQLSMQASLEWSVAMLSPPERTLFERVAAFDASFTPAEACASARPVGFDDADVLDHLGGLVAKSLVERVGTAADVRFRLLHITRDYARQLRGAGVDS
ncbi:MAG: winged helix-turn-helix domain-containing protein [Caldimonas sp.]